jgi:hypothetical protein
MIGKLCSGGGRLKNRMSGPRQASTYRSELPSVRHGAEPRRALNEDARLKRLSTTIHITIDPRK